jgi:DNA-binding transcriptional LysR family regulator
MDLKQLYYFSVVAQEKQITAAAKRLYLSQPVLSYQLKQLEKSLGVKLFRRTARGIQLTPAGVVLDNYATRIVNLSETAKDKVSEMGTGAYGDLNLGVVSSSTGYMESRDWADFIANSQKVTLHIYEANTYQVVDMLADHIVDLALVRAPFNKQGLETMPLQKDKMSVVSRDEIVYDTALSLKQLATQRLIVYRRFLHHLKQVFEFQGLKPDFAVICDDARTALACARMGMGAAILPQSIVTASGLQVYELKENLLNTELELAWRQGDELQPLTKKVISVFTNSEEQNNKETK